MRPFALATCAALVVLGASAPAASASDASSGERAQSAATSLPRPVRIARNHAAHSRHLRASQVRVVSYKRTTWNDGCLGLGGPDVMCTQAMVPGYRAVFVVRGRRVVYRTDLGDHFEIEP